MGQGGCIDILDYRCSQLAELASDLKNLHSTHAISYRLSIRQRLRTTLPLAFCPNNSGRLILLCGLTIYNGRREILNEG